MIKEYIITDYGGQASSKSFCSFLHFVNRLLHKGTHLFNQTSTCKGIATYSMLALPVVIHAFTVGLQLVGTFIVKLFQSADILLAG